MVSGAAFSRFSIVRDSPACNLNPLTQVGRTHNTNPLLGDLDCYFVTTASAGLPKAMLSFPLSVVFLGLLLAPCLIQQFPRKHCHECVIKNPQY